jgi:hypothetical protein
MQEHWLTAACLALVVVVLYHNKQHDGGTPSTKRVPPEFSSRKAVSLAVVGLANEEYDQHVSHVSATMTTATFHRASDIHWRGNAFRSIRVLLIVSRQSWRETITRYTFRKITEHCLSKPMTNLIRVVPAFRCHELPGRC